MDLQVNDIQITKKKMMALVDPALIALALLMNTCVWTVDAKGYFANKAGFDIYLVFTRCCWHVIGTDSFLSN